MTSNNKLLQERDGLSEVENLMPTASVCFPINLLCKAVKSSALIDCLRDELKEASQSYRLET